MTFQELHDACDIELDKHEAPWFDAPKKDYFLNNAQDIIVDLMHEQFEIDEQARKDAVSLVINPNPYQRSTYSQGVGTIRYSNSNFTPGTNLPGIPFLRYILSVAIKNEVCSDEEFRPVKPIRWDEWNEVRNNAFYAPDKMYPVYLERNNLAQIREIIIKGDPDPIETSVTYLKEPVQIDAVNNPTSEPDLVERVQKHLVDIAVDLMLENIESNRQKTFYSKFKRYLGYEREPIHSNGG